jgi:aminoglycoside phosphotransferase (APT) family kinase protein
MTASSPPARISNQTTQLIESWLREHLGGEVVSLTQQARWRPVWFADVERDGQLLPLMIRGERVDSPLVFPLRHEMTLQRLLGEHGIPVPEVFGWIEELPAYVMARIPGVPHFEAATDAERTDVVREYMTLLARLHRLDVAGFAAAGIERAERPELSGALGMAAFEEVYRRTKARPDPFLEFALGWLRRNPLPAHVREAPIVWDSGQFHHQAGRITGLLDVELGHIGDPMMDLAAFRMRDTVLHFGSFDDLYATYVEAGGFELDMAAIQHHHIAFTLSNQLAFHGALAAPSATSNYMTNLQWCTETNRHAVEALAERLALELPDVDIPDAEPTSASVAHAHHVRTLGAVRADDDYLSYVLRGEFRLARHLQRFDEIGVAVVAADLDDLRPLLGHRPRSAAEGDADLEELVLHDGGARDEDLVQLFHRRFCRQHALLGPRGSAMTTHHVVQRFTGTRTPTRASLLQAD